MAITFVGVSTDTGPPLVLATPAGVVAGDLLFVTVITNNGTFPAPPAGWTRVTGVLEGPAAYKQEFLSRFAVAGEPATHQFFPTNSATGAMAAYRGVESSVPPAADASNSFGASTSAIAPTITSTAASSLLITAYGIHNPYLNVTVAAGQAERADIVGGANGVVIADEILGAAGPTGTRTGTINVGRLSTGLNLAFVPAIIGYEASVAGGVVGGAAGSIGTFEAAGSVSKIRNDPPVGPSTVEFRMRAFDSTLARDVYWTAVEVDFDGSEYTGPGPLSDIVVSNTVCD